jgi:phosphoribosylanthranilate isomerase
MKIKICGLTKTEEAEYLNKNKVDYAGMVLFFDKSKRNISIEQAKNIMRKLDSNIKKVAVVVSPNIEQAKEIELAGFDYIQIHGEIPKDLFANIHIPVFKAFNIVDMDKYEEYHSCDRIVGYVFDAQEAGSGKTFDWSLVKNIPRDEKIFILAGGLNPDNVGDAIKYLKPDGVDVSSGVENESGNMKDENKINDFVKAVRTVML